MTPWREAKRQYEREYWLAALAAAGSVSAAARLCGVNRTHLAKRLALIGIKTRPPGRYGNRGRWGDLSNEAAT